MPFYCLGNPPQTISRETMTAIPCRCHGICKQNHNECEGIKWRVLIYVCPYLDKTVFFLHVLIALTIRRTSIASFSADYAWKGKNWKNRRPNYKKIQKVDKKRSVNWRAKACWRKPCFLVRREANKTSNLLSNINIFTPKNPVIIFRVCFTFFVCVFDLSTILFVENKPKNGIVIYSWPKIVHICTQIHRKLRSSLVTFCFSFDGVFRKLCLKNR